ncbi:unnamed protein product [Caenorhabditis brenneri]
MLFFALFIPFARCSNPDVSFEKPWLTGVTWVNVVLYILGSLCFIVLMVHLAYKLNIRGFKDIVRNQNLGNIIRARYAVAPAPMPTRF